MKTAEQILIEYMQEVSSELEEEMTAEEVKSLFTEGLEIGLDFTVPMERFADQFKTSPC